MATNRPSSLTAATRASAWAPSTEVRATSRASVSRACSSMARLFVTTDPALERERDAGAITGPAPLAYGVARLPGAPSPRPVARAGDVVVDLHAALLAGRLGDVGAPP